MADKMERAFARIRAERARQEAKFGAINRAQPPDEPEWLAILMEEVGEMARVVTAASQTDSHHFEAETARRTELRLEVVSVAAVAIAWLEAMA